MGIKGIATSLCFLALGIAIGVGIAGSKPSPEHLPSTLREKFQSLADADLEEYYRLKTEEEKFKKADEILGKIMQIFLADLGLHISPSLLLASREKSSPAARIAESPGARISELPPVAAKAEPAPIALRPERWQKAERELTEIRDERSIPRFLRQAKIENLDEALKSTRRFSNRTEVLPFLNGTFAGRAHVNFENHVHLWDVKVSLNAAPGPKEVAGSLQLELSERGRPFSDTKNTGRIPALREFANGSEAVMAQAGPNIYLQIYYVKELDQLAANIYRRDSEDSSFRHVGSVVMKRF